MILTTYPGIWGFNVFDFDKGPIFYLLLALFYRLFGIGLIQGRMLSVVFAMLGLNAFYFLAKEFVTKRTAFLITIIFGTVPIYFIAAHEIRMEIIYSVFELLSFYMLVRYFKTDRKKSRYIVYAGIFSGLSLLTHPNGTINIAAFIFCLVFFDVKLTFSGIVSKKLLLAIKNSLKNIIIYAITIGLVALPYAIIILQNYGIYEAQANHLFLFTVSSIFANILQGFEMFKTFFYSFAGTSLPFLLWFVIVVVAIGIVALSLIALFIRSYDDPYVKKAFIYVLISAVLFWVLVNHENDVYMTTYLPQVIIGFGVFMDRVPSKYTGLSGWYHQLLVLLDKIKSILQKGLKKKVTIPLIICIAFVGINVISCERSIYANRNGDPNIFLSPILASGVNSTDTLLGDSTFWIPLR